MISSRQQYVTYKSVLRISVLGFYCLPREIMMTSSNSNIFRVTGPLSGEFTGHRWIPLTKASDAELWCFLWPALWINGRVSSREAGDLRRLSQIQNFAWNRFKRSAEIQNNLRAIHHLSYSLNVVYFSLVVLIILSVLIELFSDPFIPYISGLFYWYRGNGILPFV